MVVSGSEDGTAKVWELMTGECLATLHGHTKGVRAVSFSPDSKQVATGSFDNSARLWSIGSAQCTGTLKVGWVVEGRYAISQSVRRRKGTKDPYSSKERKV